MITSDAPTVFLKWIYGNGWVKGLRWQISVFCSLKDLKVKHFWSGARANPELLADYLKIAPLRSMIDLLLKTADIECATNIYN